MPCMFGATAPPAAPERYSMTDSVSTGRRTECYPLCCVINGAASLDTQRIHESLGRVGTSFTQPGMMHDTVRWSSDTQASGFTRFPLCLNDSIVNRYTWRNRGKWHRSFTLWCRALETVAHQCLDTAYMYMYILLFLYVYTFARWWAILKMWRNFTFLLKISM